MNHEKRERHEKISRSGISEFVLPVLFNGYLQLTTKYFRDFRAFRG